MPELPEVETIKSAIEKSIGKTNIIKVSINNKNLRQKIPDDFATKTEGANIISYQRLAKYIIINLDNGLSIICHLGMSGRIKIFDNTPGLIKHDHVVIETGNGAIVFNDARRFGLMLYCSTCDLAKHPLFKRIGLEPFDKALNASYLADKFKNKKVPIKVALLDQTIINGIGNIYASEALFAAGILPTREAASLSKKECGILIEKVTETLNKAIMAGGSTLRDYQKPDGSLGYFQNQHCVYNKTGERCPGCTCNLDKSGGIRKIVQAGRSSFYCATKQK